MEIPGENIDFAVSLVKLTHRALKSTSTRDHAFVPDNFPCAALKVFQTTSIQEFNDAFLDKEHQVCHSSDECGGIPAWPTIANITNMATWMCTHMKNKGDWVANAKTKSSAYQANELQSSHHPTGSSSSSRANHACWNCGSSKHLLPDCPKPHDQAWIDAA